MTKEQLAAQINGREYTQEITDFEQDHAKQNNLLIVFGGSDDIVEFRGAFCDEATGPGEVLVDRSGRILECPDRDEQATLSKFDLLGAWGKRERAAIKIEAVWGENEASWTYKTEEPHSTFEIMEDGGVYCRGMVIQL